MPVQPLTAVFLTAAAVAALLLCHARGWRTGQLLLKPLASTGILAVAWAAGALNTPHGNWTMAALALSWVGDVLLLGRSHRWLAAGLGSFLLAHLAYSAAFLARGVHTAWVAPALLATALVAVRALSWLGDRPGRLRRPAAAYAAALATMVALAVGTRDLRTVLGALAFFASDIAVARERFVSPGLANRLWGLPLYYAGQVLLALAAGG